MTNKSNETDQITDAELDAPTGLSDQDVELAQGGGFLSGISMQGISTKSLSKALSSGDSKKLSSVLSNSGSLSKNEIKTISKAIKTSGIDIDALEAEVKEKYGID